MKSLCLCAISLFVFPSFSETVRIEPTIENLRLSTASASSGQWRVTPLENDRIVFDLMATGTPPSEPVRRPANLLLLPIEKVVAFQIDFPAKTKAFETKGADIIVVFGYQDENHFYYAHISNDSDNRTHHVIMKVDGSKRSRTPIQLEKDPEPKLNGNWQHIRVTRDSEGQVAVYVDDMITPTLTTKDETWLEGRMGIGTFNDPAVFGVIELTSEALK